MNQPLHCRWLEIPQLFDLALQACEEIRITNERHLDCFDVAGAFVARRKGSEQLEVVNDGIRWGKGADEILFPEGVDAILHANARIGLAERGCWNAQVAHTAMGGGGGTANHIQQRAAADANDIGMTINVIAVNLRVNF